MDEFEEKRGCPLVVLCDYVTNPAKNTLPRRCPPGHFSGSLTFDASVDDYLNGLAPGNYVYHFGIAIKNVSGELSPIKARFDVTFTVEDPCDPATLVKAPGLEDQDYFIGPPKYY